MGEIKNLGKHGEKEEEGTLHAWIDYGKIVPTSSIKNTRSITKGGGKGIKAELESTVIMAKLDVNDVV